MTSKHTLSQPSAGETITLYPSHKGDDLVCTSIQRTSPLYKVQLTKEDRCTPDSIEIVCEDNLVVRVCHTTSHWFTATLVEDESTVYRFTEVYGHLSVPNYGTAPLMMPIGKGGFGVVFRHGPIAIKVARTAIVLNRYKRMLSNVKHAMHTSIMDEYELMRRTREKTPYVAQVLDIIPRNEFCAIVMKYYPMSLHKAILPVARQYVDKYVDQLVSFILACRELDIVHYDLKLSNILINNDGDLRVTDFGLAVTNATAGQIRNRGTITYMPPIVLRRILGEVVNGTPENVDVWSFGVIVHYLLTGRHPVDYKSAKTDKERAILLLAGYAKYRPPDELSREYRTLLMGIFRKGWTIDIVQKYLYG